MPILVKILANLLMGFGASVERGTAAAALVEDAEIVDRVVKAPADGGNSFWKFHGCFCWLLLTNPLAGDQDRDWCTEFLKGTKAQVLLAWKREAATTKSNVDRWLLEGVANLMVALVLACSIECFY